MTNTSHPDYRPGPRGRPEAEASPGQVLVMFAFFLTAMVGAVGLAVDLGFSFSERRAIQNAADAGALAGARIISKSLPSAPLTAQSDVETIANANVMSYGTVQAISCTYLNDQSSSMGACSNTVPSGATGVSVTVTEQHSTFFIRLVPGGPETVTVSARATAHVRMLAAAKDGPFLVCGVNTELVNGGDLDILTKSNGVWGINSSAIGREFKIHGPNIEKCNAKAARYKGVADQESNSSRTAPGWFKYAEGDVAGPVSADVEGPDGCKAGQAITNCVAFLPVVVNDPAETDNNRQLWAVAFAPFYITEPKSNEHYGVLLGDYVVYGRGQAGQSGWYQGYTGPIAIRLS